MRRKEKTFGSKFIKIIFKVILYINIFINNKLLWDYWINWALELQYIFLFLRQEGTKVILQVAISGRSLYYHQYGKVMSFFKWFCCWGKRKAKHVLNCEEFNIVEAMYFQFCGHSILDLNYQPFWIVDSIHKSYGYRGIWYLQVKID